MMAYREEPALHTQFPISLPNKARVMGVACICARCGEAVEGENIHGRVFWSLPNVATAEATGFCAPCQTITRLNCRFRPQGEGFRIDWTGRDNRWRSQLMVTPTLWRSLVKRLVAF